MTDKDGTIPHVPTQLYLISPLDVGGAFPERLARALEAGKGHVTAFQFRVKGFQGTAGQHEAAALAAPLQEICAAHDVAFIVNDDIALAKRLKADGVHLGQEDGTVAEARDALGTQAQIGVTCHASRHFAMEAGEAGADYVAFGAFYPSTTKDKGDAERPTPEILEWWSQIFELPAVAIGGITPENCGPLIAAGADFLAVSGAIWNGDEAQAVKAFVGQLENEGHVRGA